MRLSGDLCESDTDTDIGHWHAPEGREPLPSALELACSVAGVQVGLGMAFPVALIALGWRRVPACLSLLRFLLTPSAAVLALSASVILSDMGQVQLGLV